MPQQELADRIGVTKQQIHSYTIGKRMMTLPIAKNIAAVLHCEINDLYEWLPVEVRKKRR
jgi:DNA-binding XRE family transcriptional regulator